MARTNNNHPGRIATIIAASEVLSSTCQLYQWLDESKERFVANGCAILFRHNESFYCFSCAHVLADLQLEKTFFLMKDKMSFTVGGELFHSEPISAKARSDDSLDFAIVRLNEPVAECLLANGQKFIDISQTETIDILVDTDVLLVAGYPASKTIIDLATMALKFDPMILLTNPDLGNFRNVALTAGFHHIVKYRIKSLQEASTKERMRGPKPHGISGSGLWLFARNGQQLPVPKLIGILSEYHENRAIFVSTKIDIFLEIVRKQFDSFIKHNGITLDIEIPENPPS